MDDDNDVCDNYDIGSDDNDVCSDKDVCDNYNFGSDDNDDCDNYGNGDDNDNFSGLVRRRMTSPTACGRLTILALLPLHRCLKKI